MDKYLRSALILRLGLSTDFCLLRLLTRPSRLILSKSLSLSLSLSLSRIICMKFYSKIMSDIDATTRLNSVKVYIHFVQFSAKVL